MGVAGLFAFCVLQWGTLSTPEVVPQPWIRPWQVAWHLSLMSLLLMITATDLKGYFIVEWNCWLGLGIGLLGATVSGDFQLAHVWIDWNAEIPQIQGPDYPDWIAKYRHLHGFVWSMTGALAGGVLTAFVRWLAGFVLGKPALGSGDVLLMIMVGSYLGWQPTVIALLLAPVLGLLVGGVFKVLGSQAPLPFGPFLALASAFVLTFWSPIWMAELSFSMTGSTDRASTFAVRRFFGDPVALILVAGIATGLLVFLLG
ncbi:MAG: prepilin peptidase, partial [Planctomycetaceae bacterium]|nr:prepilin peptidase [Planctomycetaceae bacterium]